MNDIKQAAARGVAWNLAQNLVGRLLSLVVVAVLARYLDRSAFGGVSVALTVLAFGELLITQGHAEFITQRRDLLDEQIDTAFWINTGIAFALTCCIVLAAHPIAKFVDEPSIAPVLRWMSLSLLIRAASVVPTALLTRHMKFRSLSLRGLVASGIGGVVGIAAAIGGLGIYSLVLQMIVGELASVIILWSAVDWRPSFRFSRSEARELSGFGMPIFAATLLNFSSRRLDSLIIAGALGVASLGTYYMAQRVFQIANQVLNKSGDQVALSAMSRLGGDEKLRRAIYRAVEMTALLCFPLYAWMAVLAAPLVHVLFGAKWLDSAPVLAVFGIAGLPLSLSYLNAAALKAVARTRLYLMLHIILAAVYLPILLLLIGGGPVYGAVAYVIGCVVIMPVEIFLLRTAAGVRVIEYLKQLFGPFFATALSCAAMMLLLRALPGLHPILLLAATGVLGLGVYVGALAIAAPGLLGRLRDVVRSAFGKKAV
jgi:O-antigen/teichoic acid export membrane protein